MRLVDNNSHHKSVFFRFIATTHSCLCTKPTKVGKVIKYRHTKIKSNTFERKQWANLVAIYFCTISWCQMNTGTVCLCFSFYGQGHTFLSYQVHPTIKIRSNYYAQQ